MQRLPALIIALVVVAVVATTTAVGAVAWALQDDDSPGHMSPGMMAAASSSTSDWWDDDPRGPNMMGMMGGTGAASEPEYLAEMVAHHQEAVVAARALARSERAEMRAFGESIVTAQSAQIQQMQAWLKDWYPEQSASLDYRPMMRDLSELSGDGLDQAFLQDMVGHHMAAVMMSQHLLGRGTDHHQVAQLARNIRDVQHAEILQMRYWLAQWFDTDWRRGMGCGTRPGQGWGRGPGMMWGFGR